MGEYLVGSVPTSYYLGNSIANDIGKLLPNCWPPSPGQYHGRRGPAPPNSSSLYDVDVILGEGSAIERSRSSSWLIDFDVAMVIKLIMLIFMMKRG